METHCNGQNGPVGSQLPSIVRHLMAKKLSHLKTFVEGKAKAAIAGRG